MISDNKSNHISVLTKDGEWKSRKEILKEARHKLKLFQLKLFQETNKTGFKEDGAYRGILSVTSGLDLPKKPLKSISVPEMIHQRLAKKFKYVQQG